MTVMAALQTSQKSVYVMSGCRGGRCTCSPIRVHACVTATSIPVNVMCDAPRSVFNTIQSPTTKIQY